MRGDESAAYLAYVSISASEALVQKELIRTIFVKMEQLMVRKRRVGVCKQKITERCVNISKIKNNYLFPTTPFAQKRSKKDARKKTKDERRKTKDERKDRR